MPEYHEASYWDSRFQHNPTPYEWLVSPAFFEPHITAAIEASRSPRPKILHIGCGSSELSYHLPKYVKRPSQVTNVDFSQEALDLGRKGDSRLKPMKWKYMDLTDHEHVAHMLGDPMKDEGMFNVIIDKSTIDAVACGWPKPLHICHHEWLDGQPNHGVTVREGPLTNLPLPCLMAVHLALLARPGCRWVCVSFSAERFDFLKDPLVLDERKAKLIPMTAGDLWWLEKKEAIEIEEYDYEGTTGTVHKPKVFYWLYILKRRSYLEP